MNERVLLYYKNHLQYIELRARLLELRYNPYHDERGRFASGGGGGSPVSSSKDKISLTDFLKDDTIVDKEKAFKEYLKNGQINTTIEKSQQQKHQNTKAWKNQVKQAVASDYRQTPKSLLDKSIDPQEFVDKYAGTGTIQFPRSGTVVHEFITTSETAGRTFDDKTKKYIKTQRIQIKYTENGVHIFPTMERKDKK